MRPPQQRYSQGFTLIELSVVLVIIGLIVGGILVGQDMISAAATRAQVSQIEKYNTAVNTFVTKFGYLPGDIPDPYASQFGFVARGLYEGEGDGNGILEGIWQNAASSSSGTYETGGETLVFWQDLSSINMIDGNISGIISTNTYVYGNYVQSPCSCWYFPLAKIGRSSSVYTWSASGQNYFGLSSITAGNTGTQMVSNPTLPVQQAYNIDKKIDDGQPTTGNVLAEYINGVGPIVPAGTASASVAVTGAASTCYDNGNSTSKPINYSMEISNGSNPNCALSFKMQGAAR